MNKRIKKTSEEKEIFFASMSHELRNPLNSLLGSIELLDEADEALKLSLLDNAKVCSETLLVLIGNILDFSQMKAKKLLLHYSPGDIKDAILKIGKMMNTLAQNKGIYLKIKFRKQLFPLLEFDYNKLSQIMINLLGNAIKFTAKGGVRVYVDWVPRPNPSLEGKDDPVFHDLMKTSTRRQFIRSLDGFLIYFYSYTYFRT
jgi:two-component system, sensor histidine kinase